MSKALQWVLGICLVLVTLAVVAMVVVPFFLPQAAAAGWSMMPGGRHMFGTGPMMGGFGRTAFGGMAWLGLGRLLGGALMVGLIVLGVVWLVRALRPAPAAPAAAAPAPMPAPAPAAPATTSCAHCGQPLQAGWRACPYCGEKTA